MQFIPADYGAKVAGILALDGDGARIRPLVASECTCQEARALLGGVKPADLFPKHQDPEDAMAGLWLYFCCLDEAHALVQESGNPEAALWHAILHRLEPDPGNSAFWYRKAGPHPIFPAMVSETGHILREHPDAEFRTRHKWDPFAFVMFCQNSLAQPGSDSERAAQRIQLVEWQLLFDYCARPR